MPDTPVEPTGSGRCPAGMEGRVAVLGQIVRTTAASLEPIERRLDAMEGRFAGIDRRFDSLNFEHRANFRWLLGAMLGGFGALLGGLGSETRQVRWLTVTARPAVVIPPSSSSSRAVAAWVPAFAGMTGEASGMTGEAAGVTGEAAGMTGEAAGMTGRSSGNDKRDRGPRIS
jgi:hypothetical protein